MWQGRYLGCIDRKLNSLSVTLSEFVRTTFNPLNIPPRARRIHESDRIYSTIIEIDLTLRDTSCLLPSFVYMTRTLRTRPSVPALVSVTRARVHRPRILLRSATRTTAPTFNLLSTSRSTADSAELPVTSGASKSSAVPPALSGACPADQPRSRSAPARSATAP